MAFRGALYTISPYLLVQYYSLRERGKLFNAKKPTTFEDKLLWLMLYWRHPLKSRCADKYAVRSYVEEKGLGNLLPGLVKVYNASNQISISDLPERFVLKCTHGSGYNIICQDKAKFDLDAARRKLDSWMTKDLSKICGEVHYASIKPRIICEVFLEDRHDDPLNDYKVYCFDGKAHCTMVCTGRHTGKTKYDFYDLGWEKKLPYFKSSLLADRKIKKPESYDEIIESAERLSKPFPFVRVDFYSVNGRAVFGEMTFTPNGCIDPDLTDLARNIMGSLIRLPTKLLK